MLFAKYIKNFRKLKIVLLLIAIILIVVTLILINNNGLHNVIRNRLIDASFVAQTYSAINSGGRSNTGVGGGGGGGGVGGYIEVSDNRRNMQLIPALKVSDSLSLQPEKYNERQLKTRLIQQKIQNLRDYNKQKIINPEEEHKILDTVTTAVHIFYTASVQWYKNKKPPILDKLKYRKQVGNTSVLATVGPTGGMKSRLPSKILNSAFYPALGLYKPTLTLLQKHFQNIRNCGIGVLILSYTNKNSESDLYQRIIELAPQYNLSVTFELTIIAEEPLTYLIKQFQQLLNLTKLSGFYKVYSESRRAQVPLLYLNNAYKLIDSINAKAFCKSDNKTNSLRHLINGYFIGHIRLKYHVDWMRRLCFDGFYSKLPSNGVTFASTWKNWSYLKSFAITYKMLFIPTVGPGFAERNKFPRHGDIQRHRSNGRYYGVAWRTAILNHVGFINIASYNNWPDGSQIEEVKPKAGFLDYNPGSQTKYLDLTTHWVGNLIKNRQESAVAASSHSSTQLNCYEYLNNSIC